MNCWYDHGSVDIILFLLYYLHSVRYPCCCYMSGIIFTFIVMGLVLIVWILSLGKYFQIWFLCQQFWIVALIVVFELDGFYYENVLSKKWQAAVNWTGSPSKANWPRYFTALCKWCWLWRMLHYLWMCKGSGSSMYFIVAVLDSQSLYCMNTGSLSVSEIAHQTFEAVPLFP